MTLLGFAIGVVAWTFAEYVLHRWIFHARLPLSPLSSEHIAHHGDPAATSPVKRSLAYVATIAVGVAVGAVLVGGSLGIAIAFGWAIGDVGYELLHWRAHHRRPATAFTRYLQRRHMAHHFGGLHGNFGVTTPFWDTVFRTHIGSTKQ